MRPMLGKSLLIAVLYGAALLGQPAATAAAADTTATSAAGEQIVVRGSPIEQLRLRIRVTEDAVYTRFNDINSDDLFDIHCYMRAQTGSRIQRRICLSNSWRNQDANFGDSTVKQLQGEMGQNPAQYRAKQLYMEGKVVDELRRLTAEDDELGQTMVQLGQAYQAVEAMTGSRPFWTLYREVPAGPRGLPFDAQRLFEVRIGAAPWTHRLIERTFTLTSVSGHIHRLQVECDNHSARLDFRNGVEWTVPETWGECLLTVGAKRDTTFALVEFH